MNAFELQQSLQSIADRARSVNTRDFEELPLLDLEQRLVPVLSMVLAEAIQCLDSVLRHYEHENERRVNAFEGEETGEFYRRIDGLMKDESGTQRIVDLAFMTQWELRRKAQLLQAIHEPETDAWEAIARCGSARRRILKSAIAVETAIGEHEALPCKLKDLYRTEINRALETRRAYAILRRELRRDPGENAHSIKQALRTAGIAIARLIGRDVYEDLRVTDRRELRALQARILAWLGSDHDLAADSGLEIWRDLSAFSDLLFQVNHRAELRECDRGVLADAYATLFSVHPFPETIPVAVRHKLEPLLGRDVELDELIENPGSRTVGEWQAPMRRLLQALDTAWSGQDSLGWETQGEERAPSFK